MAGRTLRSGEALPLTRLGVSDTSELHLSVAGVGAATPDLVALVLAESGKVRSDDDLIFYNNPTSADRAVGYLGARDHGETTRIVPARLDADVTKIVVGCAGDVLAGAAGVGLRFTLADSGGQVVASAEFETDAAHRAVILAEVYNRAGEWRFRLLAQGYSGGLAALVTEFGVVVEDDAPQPAPTVAPPAPAPTATPAPPAGTWTPPPAPSPYPPATTPPATTPSPYGFPPPPAQRRGGLFTSRRRAQLEAENAELNRVLQTSGALDNAALDAERRRLAGEIASLAGERDRRHADLQNLELRLAQVRASIGDAEADVELADVGLYRYRHRLDDAVAYRGRIDGLKDHYKQVARSGRAVTGSTTWTVNGSIAEGRRMVREFSKLMLRAYNADADQFVRTMRPYKLDSVLARLDATRDTIARLGQTMSIRISDEYHWLRRQELELVADYLSKSEEEKERQRELRERQREEQRALAEFQREQERLEKERARYADALRQMEARGDEAKAVELRSQLRSIEAGLAGVANRRANVRVGHVYVISNVGAFGRRMVKIGMTRRLNPEDRIRELGDASVPFRFDKHALIFSEDAVGLETALHRRFAEQRVNRVNAHREFFYVTPAEVRDALAELGSQFLLEFNEEVDAPEWRQSGGPERALLPT